MTNMEWYSNLKKSKLTPPKWVFGPVWTILYGVIAFSSYRLLDNKSCQPFCLAAGIYAVQLILNLFWTTIFFRMKKPFLALVNILAMISLMLIMLIKVYRLDKIVFYLNIPYVMWLAFACYLNLYIYINN